MGRIFEIEYTVRTVKKMNNVYAKAFYVNSFKIGGVEQEWDELRVSYGYVNFKDGIKKLKRKCNYNKLKDNIFVFQVIDGQRKICQALSSEDKIVGIPATFNPEYEGSKILSASLKNRFILKDGYLDMQETNFATKDCMKCLDSLIEEGANKMKDTNNNTFLHEFYEGLSPEMKQIFKALAVHESGRTTFRKEESIMYEIKNVYINETKGVTTIVFGNGDKIKVVKDSEDKNDIEKAIAIAIIKYYFGLDYYFDACKKVVNAEKKAKSKKKKLPKPTPKPRPKKKQIDPEKEVK